MQGTLEEDFEFLVFTICTKRVLCIQGVPTILFTKILEILPREGRADRLLLGC